MIERTGKGGQMENPERPGTPEGMSEADVAERSLLATYLGLSNCLISALPTWLTCGQSLVVVTSTTEIDQPLPSVFPGSAAATSPSW